jgi:cell division protein FtsI/penicillin-binding protein 2
MKLKIKLTLLLFILAGGAVITKAFYVSIINRDKLIAYSNSQFVRTQKIYPKRGRIYDRNMNPLAINIRKYNIFTIPKNGKHDYMSLKKLAKVTEIISYKDILKKIKGRNKYTWLARKVDLTENEVEKIKQLKNIFIEPEDSRFYPNHEVAGQILGFVGVDNEGLGGIEFEFNKRLKGKPKIRKYYRDAKGRPVKITEAKVESEIEHITLSIDKDIQASVENFLKQGIKKHKAEGGGAGVIDAETGEILAVANYPFFDPNHISRKNQKRRVSFITDPIEPGSVFKTFTIASAMENNIVKSDTSYFCEQGKMKIGTHWINESDSSHKFEWLTVEDILKYSSNVGTTKIAFETGYPVLKKTLQKLNFGEKTGVEYPGESRGIFTKENKIKPIRLSNISFGQGIATTGIQILSAYAAIANGGYYIKPTLLKRDKKKIKRRKVFKIETTKELTRILTAAVEDGTGTNAKLLHFTIAGKTSTAQRASSDGGYEGYISGFVGYPVDTKKKFVVFVYVDNPKDGYYGNTVAAPIFNKITKSIILKNKEYQNLNTVTYSANDSSIDKVSMKSSGVKKYEQGIMPNLIGLDKRTAQNILSSMNIDFNMSGYGVVIKQSPESGTKINQKTLIELVFRAPSYE